MKFKTKENNLIMIAHCKRPYSDFKMKNNNNSAFFLFYIFTLYIYWDFVW